MTDLTPFGVDHIRPLVADRILLPRGDSDSLDWGWRLCAVDMASSHGYRWPYPGRWAKADGPFDPGNTGPCPATFGDGICVARTIVGAQSGSARFAHHVGLLVAWRPADLLGDDTDKVRVRRAWVAATFDPVAALVASTATADLRGANLWGANLQNANLWGANLRGANLWGADLQNANLRGANLQNANLWGADLRGANLRGANLQNANLRGADLWNADLQNANLQNANLWGADLWNANLRGANLQNANLWSANLRGANLRGANLGGAMYSQGTVWPAEFDVAASGAVLV